MRSEDASNVTALPGNSQRALRSQPLSSILQRSVPARRWVVPGMVPAGAVTLLSGEGSAGKSLLALQLAISTALNRPWLDMAVMPGKPLLISAEDDVDEIHRRAASIVEALGVGSDERERLVDVDVVSLVGEDAVLAAPQGASLRTTPLYSELDAHISDRRPSLVILDTLADLFGGDENQRTHARQFIGLLRGWCARYLTTIVVLAHPSQSGRNTGSGESGSTGWSNSVRSRLYLERGKSDDERILTVKKANYGGSGATVRLKWVRGSFSRLAGPAPAPESSPASAKAEERFLSLLAATTGDGQIVSNKPGANYAPAVFEQTHAGSRKAMTSAMNRLLSIGKIRAEKVGPESKKRWRLVVADHSSNAPSNAKIPTEVND